MGLAGNQFRRLPGMGLAGNQEKEYWMPDQVRHDGCGWMPVFTGMTFFTVSDGTGIYCFA